MQFGLGEHKFRAARKNGFYTSDGRVPTTALTSPKNYRRYSEQHDIYIYLPLRGTDMKQDLNLVLENYKS